MPNEKQVIPAVFAEGVDTHSDPKITAQGLLRLENAVINQAGGFRKRFGLKSYTLANEAKWLSRNEDRPVAVGEKFYKFDSDDPLDGNWVDYGHSHLTCSCETQLRAQANHRSWGGDCAKIGDVIYTVDYRSVWNPSTLIFDFNYYVESWNAKTKQLIESQNSDWMIRLLKTSANTLYIILFGAGGLPAYFLQTIDDEGDIPNGAATIIDGAAPAGAGDVLDVCFMEDDEGTIAVAYAVDTTNDVELILWEIGVGTNLVNIATTTAAVVPAGFITVWKQRDNCVLLSYIDQASPDVLTSVGYNKAGAVVITSTTMYTAGGSETLNNITGMALTTTTSLVFFSIFTSGLPSGAVLKVSWKNLFTDTAGTGSAGTEEIFHLSLATVFKPFYYNGQWYILCAYVEQEVRSDQKSFILFDEDGHMVGTYLYGYAWELKAQTNARFIDYGSGQYGFIAGRIIAEDSAALSLVDFNFNILPLHMVSISHYTQIPGDIAYEFDGETQYEQQFPWGPFLSGGSSGGAGPPSVTPGLHGYVTVYEWLDANGHRHQSAPSTIELITVGATERVTLTMPTLSITTRVPTEISIVVYRTLADEGTYFRLFTTSNDPTVFYIQHVDQALDAEISDNEQLYTTGHVLANKAPPAYTISAIHQRRVFVVNKHEQTWDIRYSKELNSLGAVEFSPFLTIPCDVQGSDIVAMCSQSDRLVIFKEKTIFATHGEGQSINGSGPGYAIPYLVSEAIGCINQKSVVQTPVGIMFDSGEGIYLLDKQFRVSFIGEAIDHYYKQVSISSAEIRQDLELIIFITDGVALIYDYRHEVWSTYTGHEGSDIITTLFGTFFTNVAGTAVKTEQADTYRDDATTLVSMRIRTGWFSFAKLTGFQRIFTIKLLGQNRDPHRLRVKTAYDFDPVFIDNQTFDSDDLGGYSDTDDHYGDGLSSAYQDKAYMLDLGTSLQECTSIMVEISDEEIP